MEVYGLPVHALVVHAAVVFVPLAAVGGIVVSLWRWARDRYGTLVLGVALVALVVTYVAQLSGTDLYESMPAHTPQLDMHMELATPLVYYVLGMTVGQAALIAAWWLGRRQSASRPTWLTVLHWAGVVLSVVFGVLSTIQVVRAGHAGAVSVWG